MVAPTPAASQVAAWRAEAQMTMARIARNPADPRLEAATQDFVTARVAELVERELSKVRKLRPEQVVAIKAILAGASAAEVLPDALRIATAA